MPQKNDLRICVDAREIKKGMLTGIGRFTASFLKGLDLSELGGYFCFADPDTDTSEALSRFKILKARRAPVLWSDQVSLARLIRKNRIDVFFSPYYKMPFFSGCRNIITIHDLYFLENELRKGFERFKPFVTYLKCAVRMADMVITVSEFSKGCILRMFDIDPGKVRVVYNGVDPVFKVCPPQSRGLLVEKYGIDSKYVLYVGNMRAHKNLPGLLEAFALIPREDRKDARLVVIARKDKNFKPIERRVRSLGLEGQVVFLDFVPDPDLVLFYNFAEAFVFPSFYEGFGLPPLEAMACGAPVVSSDKGALKEVLGECALYVDPYNRDGMARGMALMLNEAGLREEYKAKGMARAANFSARAFSGSLAALLNEK